MNNKISGWTFHFILILIVLMSFMTASKLLAASQDDKAKNTSKSNNSNNNVPFNSSNTYTQEEMTNPKEIFNQTNQNLPPAEAPVTQRENLGYFHAINLSGIGDLHISQAEEMEFTIEAEPSILPLIIVNVKDQVLNLDLKDASQHESAKINYYLKIKTIDEINSYSASTISIPDKFETKTLKVSLLSGFGEAKMNLDVTTLISKIIGAGKIEVSGVADEQELTINGVGEFDGSKLKSKVTKITMSSSGIAKVNASETLEIKLKGNGHVKYCGNPTIIKEVSKKAVIEQLDASECQQ